MVQAARGNAFVEPGRPIYHFLVFRQLTLLRLGCRLSLAVADFVQLQVHMDVEFADKDLDRLETDSDFRRGVFAGSCTSLS